MTDPHTIWMTVAFLAVLAAVASALRARRALTLLQRHHEELAERRRVAEELLDAKDLFETFMQHSPAIAFIKSDDDRLLYVNPTFEEQIWNGAPPDWRNRRGEELWPPDMARQFRANDVRILESGRAETVEETVVKAQGNETWLSFKFPLRRRSGARCLAGMAINLTERKQAAADLARSHRLLATLSRSQARFITGTDSRATFADLLATLLEVTDSEYGFIGEVLYQSDGQPYLKTHAITDIAWNEATRAFYEQNAAQGLEFHNLRTLFGVVLTSGQPVIANDAANDPRRAGIPAGHPPLRSFLGLPFHRGPELVGMVGVANRPDGYDEELVRFLDPFLFTSASLIIGLRLDRARLQAEAALRSSEERLRLALDAGQMGTWVWDVQARRSTWSAREFDLFGLPFNPGGLSDDIFYEHVHPDDRAALRQVIDEVLQTGQGYNHEFRVVRPDGQVRWLGGLGQRECDAAGRPVRMVGVNFDITDRKAAEADMRSSLREKEALLREVHHRVKNNLQLISSMLSLQALHVDDPQAQAVFTASQHRIHTLALVHETIYRSDSFNRIDLARYVEELCQHLCAAHDADRHGIRLVLKLAPATLDLDRAIPCGLIVNELVTNALRHAFPDKRTGIVSVSLGEEGPGGYNFRVSDDGIGLPKDQEPHRTESMGLHMVHLLTRQLHGTLTVERSAGTALNIVFPSR